MRKKFDDIISYFKNKSEKRKVLSLGGMISVVIALAVYLVLEFAVGAEKLTFWPVWSFFIALFFATGLVYVLYGLIRRHNAMLLVGFGCAIIGVMFLLISFSLDWAIVISVTALLVVVLYGATFMIRSPIKTDADDAADSAYSTDEPREEHVDED